MNTKGTQTNTINQDTLKQRHTNITNQDRLKQNVLTINHPKDTILIFAAKATQFFLMTIVKNYLIPRKPRKPHNHNPLILL